MTRGAVTRSGKRIRKRIRALLVVSPVFLVLALVLARSDGEPPARPGFVASDDTDLRLDGRDYRFTGVNAFQLATYWAVNEGCGEQVDDLDGFFASLRSGSMVRFWAFQELAFAAKTTQGIDFTPIDRVVAAAERQSQKLVVVLANQAGTCDGEEWLDQAWYDGGYRRSSYTREPVRERLPFLDWMRAVVLRYRNSPAVGMWELVNEPEASNCTHGVKGSECYSGYQRCPPGAAASLRRFFDEAGGELQKLDPDHLLSSGVIGGQQCGLAGEDYRRVHASPAIDVASYHDYGDDRRALHPDLRTRLDQAGDLGKPLVVGEAGITAGTGAECTSLEERALLFEAKLRTGFDRGISGYLLWNRAQSERQPCDHRIGPDDPVLRLLRAYPKR